MVTMTTDIPNTLTGCKVRRKEEALAKEVLAKEALAKETVAKEALAKIFIWIIPGPLVPHTKFKKETNCTFDPLFTLFQL